MSCAEPTSDPSLAPNSEVPIKSKAKNFDRSVLWKKARQNKQGEYDDEEIEKQAAIIVMSLITHLATVDDLF